VILNKEVDQTRVMFLSHLTLNLYQCQYCDLWPDGLSIKRGRLTIHDQPPCQVWRR